MITIQDEVEVLDKAMLTPIVRQVLKNSAAEPLDWEVKPIIEHSHVRYVYRIQGTAQVEAQQMVWSVILKIIFAPSSESVRRAFVSYDPTRCDYWKREFEVYRSSLPLNLSSEIAAPQIYEVKEQPNGYWMWLEMVEDEWGKASWPLSQYALTARSLGGWNGLYVTTRHLPTYPWLARDDGLPRWAAEQIHPEYWLQLAALREREPLMRRRWPDNTLAESEQLWLEREGFFRAIAKLPKTLAHGDVDCKNAMARKLPNGGDQTVLIDWSCTGIAPLGQDVACLAAGSVYYFILPPEQFPDLHETIFEAYLEGLRDVGWRGDPLLVRFEHMADFALRFGFILAYKDPQKLRFDEEYKAYLQETWGYTLEQRVEMEGALRRHAMACATEARHLMERLSL